MPPEVFMLNIPQTLLISKKPVVIYLTQPEKKTAQTLQELLAVNSDLGLIAER